MKLCLEFARAVSKYFPDSQSLIGVYQDRLLLYANQRLAIHKGVETALANTTPNRQIILNIKNISKKIKPALNS